MSRFRLLTAFAALGAPLYSAAVAQSSRPAHIAYRIAMPDPATHLYDVELDVDGVRGRTLALQLPV